MKNVLIFQPYLSNRKLSSGTIERQCRFLKYEKDIKVYALFDDSEKDYANTLKDSWVEPIIVNNLCNRAIAYVRELQQKYNFTDIYVVRPYFTPCTEENINKLKDFSLENNDEKYIRDYIPIEFCLYQGVLLHQIVYDPLEVQYDKIVGLGRMFKYSSMNNVENAKPHLFADLGYYDKNNEVPVEDKTLKFTFGATSVEPNRTKMLLEIYTSIIGTPDCQLYLRADNIDTLVPNDVYEQNVSKSLFTYTVPSYDPKHMSFTRMLLALSQGTIPLIHPENNLDCLFGEGFEIRDSLKDFFKKLIVSPSRLEDIVLNDMETLKILYDNYLTHWHSTEYYQWLQQTL